MFTTKSALAIMLGFLVLQASEAAPLRSGLGGVAGYGQLSQTPNDDGSSNEINLPFSINFFGTSYSSFFINNNGNVSFSDALSEFTPERFPSSRLPIIAPYWADVDTRNQPNGGAVYVAAPNTDTVVVTWNNVGYYSRNNDKLNDFQMTLVNRSDTGTGNFDIEFRYNKLEWTTGSASGGVGGLGGTPAQAGYDAGNGNQFFVLPGSFTNDVLELANTSNVSQEAPGLWTMAIRNGTTSDGSSPNAPLLPVIVNDAGFQFNFGVQLGTPVFIDPEVAIGYEYRVNAGPNILRALFPTIAGDADGYQIFSLNNILLGTATPGVWFDFASGGVNGFRLLGIDVAAGLDPANVQAFVTGLEFVESGQVSMVQDPIVINTDGTVPEPASLMLLAVGALASLANRRRRSIQA